jgi:hypothetical protein
MRQLIFTSGVGIARSGLPPRQYRRPPLLCRRLLLSHRVSFFLLLECHPAHNLLWCHRLECPRSECLRSECLRSKCLRSECLRSECLLLECHRECRRLVCSLLGRWEDHRCPIRTCLRCLRCIKTCKLCLRVIRCSQGCRWVRCHPIYNKCPPMRPRRWRWWLRG